MIFPRSAHVGQTVRRGKGKHLLYGKVISIPSHRRFAVVEYTITGKGVFGLTVTEKFREAVPIEPPAEQIAQWQPAAFGTHKAPKPPDDDAWAIGARIIAARKRAGLTQAELGKLVQRSNHTVRDWEQRGVRPKPEVWPALCDALGATPGELKLV